MLNYNLYLRNIIESIAKIERTRKSKKDLKIPREIKSQIVK